MAKSKKTSDYSDLFTTHKQRKARANEDSSWSAMLRKPTAHVCPECGESKNMNIIRLRRGLYECRKCKHTFVDSPIGEEDND